MLNFKLSCSIYRFRIIPTARGCATLRVKSSASAAVRVIIASITILLETRPYGIRVAGYKHEIARSFAFRLTETAMRGTTRFPDTLERSDVGVVMQHIPHSTVLTRDSAKELLTVLVREEIKRKRLVAVEVESTQRRLRQKLTEYWIMTSGQWERFQGVPLAELGIARYHRALTSR